MTKVTAPIGVDESGAPIEEVVTTATRIRFPWMQLLAGAAIGLLVMQLDEPPRPKRRKAKRAKR